MKYLAQVFAFAVVFVVARSSSDFSYYDQNLWSGECNTGQRQSPINIDTNRVECRAYLKPLLLSHEYYTYISGTWENTGHTVKFTPANHIKAYMLTPVGTYKLVQVHIHWGQSQRVGSEHLVQGHSADFELHFVHKKVGAVDQTARDYNAVLSVRGYGTSAAPWTHTLNQLNTIHIEDYGYKSIVTINLSSLLPTNPFLDYFYYEGSLTTPDCNERVQWFVVKNTISVPLGYLENLRRIRDKNGYPVTFNYRGSHNYNGRIVTQVWLYVCSRVHLKL